MKSLRITILTLSVLLATSCSDDEPLNWKIDKQRINELITMSNQQVTIDGTTLELYTYLQRDFMPIAPPDGRGLASVNWIVDVDSIAIPETVILSEQYVINGDSLWTATYKNDQRETPPYIIEKTSINGPKWQPNIEVTVIAKVIDSRDNSEYYLIKDRQQIQRTE